jgi:hypothetical protein
MLILSALGGCYPHGAQYTTDLDLVYTSYSTSFDFKSHKTFSIPDSVIEITGDVITNGGGRPTMANPTYATPLLNQLTTDMEKYGWTKVARTANPDVYLLASLMTTTNIYYYYDWGYWGWYYPGYYPGWGWYYPGYYPPYVTGYKSGSIFVQMVDAKSLSHDSANIPVVWNSILNGLAQGGTSDILSRITINVDQAFTQSPYLKH